VIISLAQEKTTSYPSAVALLIKETKVNFSFLSCTLYLMDLYNEIIDSIFQVAGSLMSKLTLLSISLKEKKYGLRCLILSNIWPPDYECYYI
jgi:hypothetical protein